MKDQVEIEAEAIHLVEEVSGAPVEKLTLDARLEHDLGITGDDASELLWALHQRYGVDISEFKFDDYFGSEGANPFLLVYHLIRGTANKRKPLRIRDIAEAMKVGSLR